MTKKIVFLVSISILVCACALPIFHAESIPTETPPAETQEALPSPEVQETPAIGGPAEGLNPEGPWWLLAGSAGAWAVNADGTHLTQVITEALVRIDYLQHSVSPSGGYVAYLTYADAQNSRGLTLKLLRLPSGDIQTITALTSPETEPPADAEPGDPALEALRALTELPSMNWSPDGKNLVFSGVMDGPAADLYLYKTSDGSITRLTQNSAHAVNPLWAPEGGRVAFITLSDLGAGAGPVQEGFWVVDTYTGSLQAIPYAPPEFGSLELIGWIAPDTLLVDTWSPLCGSSQLSAVRVPEGDFVRLWEGCFNNFQVAYDPNSGAVLTEVDSLLAQFNPDPSSGLLWMDAKSGIQRWLSDVSGWTIEYLPAAGLFTASNDTQALLIAPDGAILESITLPASNPTETGQPPRPLFSADASTWALSATSAATQQTTLWVGERGGALHEFAFEAVERMTFLPADNRLLLKTSNALYLAQPPDFTPARLEGDFSDLNDAVLQDAWVMP